MSNCSQHRKDLFGETDMKKVAEAIGDLHYEAMAELYNHLAEKHMNDHLKNREDHPDEAAALIWMHHAINKASYGAERAWKICKPFMTTTTPINSISANTDLKQKLASHFGYKSFSEMDTREQSIAQWMEEKLTQ